MQMEMGHFMFWMVNLLPPEWRACVTFEVTCWPIGSKMQKEWISILRDDFDYTKKESQRKGNRGHLRKEGGDYFLFYLIH